MRLFSHFLAMCLITAPFQAMAFDHGPVVREMRTTLRTVDSLRLAGNTDKAIEGLLRLAEREVARKGGDIGDLRAQWDGRFKGYLGRLLQMRELGIYTGVGDHAPLNQWLEDLYDRLEGILGPELMVLFHLDDIKTLNYCIPVVFHLSMIHDGEIDEPEYALHFVPFCGVVSYWSVWLICEGATYGSGWFVVCTPAAMAAEYAVETWVAPKFAPAAFDRFY